MWIFNFRKKYQRQQNNENLKLIGIFSKAFMVQLDSTEVYVSSIALSKDMGVGQKLNVKNLLSVLHSFYITDIFL